MKSFTYPICHFSPDLSSKFDLFPLFLVLKCEKLENALYLYCRGLLTGPTRTGPMLLENEIIDILKNHFKPRDQLSRTHEINLKKYTLILKYDQLII